MWFGASFQKYLFSSVCVCGGGESFIALVSESWEQPHQVLIFEVV